MTTLEVDLDARSYSTTHVPAKSTPKYHCAHTGGEMSILVSSGRWSPVDVYVTGDRADIVTWALAVAAAAIAGEEGD